MLAAAALAVRARPAAAAAPVHLLNESHPTLCAEHDNVYFELSGDTLRSFRIEAAQPPYGAGIVTDTTAPDWDDCPPPDADPAFTFEPAEMVLFEDADWQMVGHTFPRFWRPDRIPFTVGKDKTVAGLHLVRLLRKGGPKAIEVLVLYPADGYWRPKPLPPSNLPDNIFGSSFLVGPIEHRHRPIVDISAVRFDPTTQRFDLDFKRGGSGSLAIVGLDAERLVLAVTFTEPVSGGPFAGLRSMFVTADNCDVGLVDWTAGGATSSSPVMEFKEAAIDAVRFGRDVPSQHNTSAPDLVFTGFAA